LKALIRAYKSIVGWAANDRSRSRAADVWQATNGSFVGKLSADIPRRERPLQARLSHRVATA
jgi:hypothetical protein